MIKLEIELINGRKHVVPYEKDFTEFKDMVIYGQESGIVVDETGLNILVRSISTFKQLEGIF